MISILAWGPLSLAQFEALYRVRITAIIFLASNFRISRPAVELDPQISSCHAVLFG